MDQGSIPWRRTNMPLLVKTKLREVSGKGIGLFADEFIKKDQIIYQDDISFDRVISKTDLNKMPKVTQEFIKEYAAYSKSKESYYLCCDNARFWNHSDNPNTRYVDSSGAVFALRDIAVDEELTSDYREFCDHCKDGDFGFTII